MKYCVKLYDSSFEDYIDYGEYDTKEEAEKEVAELKKNGELAIIERFTEASRDSELTSEVDWYNSTFNN